METVLQLIKSIQEVQTNTTAPVNVLDTPETIVKKLKTEVKMKVKDTLIASTGYGRRYRRTTSP